MVRTAVATGDEPDRPAPQPSAITLPDVPPILVTINCPEAIPTFRPSNPLHQQFGFTGFVRVDAKLPPHYTVDPNPDEEGVFQPFFQDDPEGLTWARLCELRQQPDWLAELAYGYVLKQITARLRDGGLGGYVQLVTAVVLNNGWRLVDPDPQNIARRALQPGFSTATFYAVDPEEGCELTEIWNDEFCPTCLNQLKPAGSMYVCEGCGNTKPRKEPPLTADQPEGEDPTQEKVDPPQPYTKLCGRCGDTMRLCEGGTCYHCPNCGKEDTATPPVTVQE